MHSHLLGMVTVAVGILTTVWSSNIESPQSAHWNDLTASSYKLVKRYNELFGKRSGNFRATELFGKRALLNQHSMNRPPVVSVDYALDSTDQSEEVGDVEGASPGEYYSQIKVANQELPEITGAVSQQGFDDGDSASLSRVLVDQERRKKNEELLKQLFRGVFLTRFGFAGGVRRPLNKRSYFVHKLKRPDSQRLSPDFFIPFPRV